MAQLLGMRRHDRDPRKLVCEILLDVEESRNLRGEVDNLHVLAEGVANVSSRVSLRGKNEATQYFLIPRQLRKKLDTNASVSCQRLESDGKTLFLYVLDPCKGGRRSYTPQRHHHT